LEVHPPYLQDLREDLRYQAVAERLELLAEDFFACQWKPCIEALPGSLLVLGNPPWVTSSQLGCLGSANHPGKENSRRLPGIEAITGRANFDISEWMLQRQTEWFAGRRGVLAVLVKTAVARKLLTWCWSRGMPLVAARLYQIDASHHFQASVEAGFLVLWMGEKPGERTCSIFSSLEASGATSLLGMSETGELIADLDLFKKTRYLELGEGGEEVPRWRSGVKHDCARVFELRREGEGFQNGLGQVADVEAEVLYPLLKSSDVAHSRLTQPRRWLLLSQRTTGEDPAWMRQIYPRAWAYLCAHRAATEGRRSAVYRGRPEFSLFGIGEYTLAPWKLCISSLYKELHFVVVGPHKGQSVLVDDTVNFLPFAKEAEARRVCALLLSPPAQEFFRSRIFWGAKRPVTIRILMQISLPRLAQAVEVSP
jgi:hypothetical protein